jgi:hypothetical protein
MKLHFPGSAVLALFIVMGPVVSASAQTAITQNNLLLNGGYDSGQVPWNASAQGQYFYVASGDSIASIGWVNGFTVWQNTTSTLNTNLDYVITTRIRTGDGMMEGLQLSFQDATTGGTVLTNIDFGFPAGDAHLSPGPWRVFSLYVNPRSWPSRAGHAIGVGVVGRDTTAWGQYGWLHIDWVQLAPASPQFVSQPQSVTNSLESSVTLTANALGAVMTNGPLDLRYQWYKTPAIPVPNATNAALTFTSLTLAAAGSYYVVATNRYGSSQSSNATVVVINNSRTILVQSNTNWRFIKGQSEASTPINVWRGLAFNDTGWSNALAPFYYGDPYNSATNPGTLLSDMLGGYSSIYLRKTFTLTNAAAATNLYLNALSDDGFIAWINGVEVVRFNMAAGEIPYNSAALTSVTEPGNAGVPYVLYTLNNAGSYLIDGVNVLTVHAFNNQPATSTDFGFNAQLFTYLTDPGIVAPYLASISPAAGDRFFLTNITVRFTEPVSGVDPGDLLVNGVPATGLGSTTNTTYTFAFTQPAYGNVAVTWTGGHGIVDFDAPPKSFETPASGTRSSTSAAISASWVSPPHPKAGLSRFPTRSTRAPSSCASAFTTAPSPPALGCFGVGTPPREKRTT